MKFGICASLDHAAAAHAGGWDYLEITAAELLRTSGQPSPLPVLATNVLVPGSLKITGPQVEWTKLRDHVRRVVEQGALAGVKIVVFGSGGARNVPPGFDREQAEQQIVEFCLTVSELAAAAGMTVVIEPLNRGECNIVNSVREAMEYVTLVKESNFRCLVDSYHLWQEGEPLDHVRPALPSIAHVHVADQQGRVAPGQSKTADYGPLFGVLKGGGYDSTISVEALDFDIANRGSEVLSFLKQQWKDA
jgi:sugar phosphate isomerase/epimerase